MCSAPWYAATSEPRTASAAGAKENDPASSSWASGRSRDVLTTWAKTALPSMAASTRGRSNGSRASGSARRICGSSVITSASRAGPRRNGRSTSAARKRLRAETTFSSPSRVLTAQAHAVGPCTSTPFASAIPPSRIFSSGIGGSLPLAVELAGVRHFFRPFIRRVGLSRIGSLGLDTRAVLQRRLVDRVDELLLVAGEAVADREDPARPVAGADEHVVGLGRTVDEVPRLQRPLLPLDDQQTFAEQDEKIFLLVLAVVHARRLARLHHADVDADVFEAGLALALEGRPRPERRVLEPARLLGVDDEPALAGRDKPCICLLERCLWNHPHPPICRATCRRKRTPSSRSSTAIRSSAEWTRRAATSGSIVRIGKKPYATVPKASRSQWLSVKPA